MVSVQLRGGNRPNEGQVEMSVSGVTGTICDLGFDNSDATVICRMLGYRLALSESRRNNIIHNIQVISSLDKGETQI